LQAVAGRARHDCTKRFLLSLLEIFLAMWRKEKINRALYKFHKWRYRHISHDTYMMILSVLVGIISGMVAVVMKNTAHLIESVLEWSFLHNLMRWYFVFPVIGIGLTLLIIRYVIKKPVPDGIPVILESITKRKSLIPAHYTYANLITAPFTVGFGGSVGLEGPSALTGAAIGSQLSRLLHLNLKQRNMLLAAATAGTFSSIFKAPVAAILFVVEVLSFDLTMTNMMPLIFASVTAILTSYFFMGDEILLHFVLKHKFYLREIPFYALLGITSATTSIYFLKSTQWIAQRFQRVHSTVRRWLTGGILLGALLFAFPLLYGEGYDAINHLLLKDYHYILNKFPFAVSHNDMLIIILLFALLVTFKPVAMQLTFVAGGIGGVFAPSMFTGAVSGFVTALALNATGWLPYELPPENFALVGMAGAVAGIIHAPLMAVFLIMEITGGHELIIPLMTVAGISFFISKKMMRYNIYTAQLKDKKYIPTHDKDKFAGVMVELDRVVEKDLIPLKPGMTLGEMVREAIMKSHRHIFPVLDDHNHLLGIVSLDDVRQIMFNREMYDKIRVRDLMHHAPAAIYYGKDDFQRTMYKFQSSGAWNLPVIREDGTYVGFMSKSKLLSVYRKKMLEITDE